MELLQLSGKEDWLLRPMGAGYCKFESLKDGTLDLADIALMNEKLDVDEENRNRINKVLNNGR